MAPGKEVVVISITFTALAGCFVILRCLSRLKIQKFGADDVFATLAYLSSVAFTVSICLEHQRGLGQAISHVQLTDLFEMLKYLWISIIAFALSMVFIATSALLQYLRFLVEPRYRILCWVVLTSNVLYATAAIIVNFFACQPLAYFWNKLLQGKCIDNTAFWLFSAAYIIVVSIIVVAIPIFAIKDMTMPHTQKRALYFVFTLGGLSCITAVLRLYSVYKATTSIDITKDLVQVTWWSSIEINITIIGVSAPPLKALIVAVAPRLLADETSNERLESQDWLQPQVLQSFPDPNSLEKRPSADPYEIP